MENKIGRHLKPDEIVHHIDNDINNNEIDNLQLMTRAEHTKHHLTKEEVKVICTICLETFLLKPSIFRRKMKKSKTGKLACSQICGGKLLSRNAKARKSQLL